MKRVYGTILRRSETDLFLNTTTDVARSSRGLGCLPFTEEIRGSNPLRATKKDRDNLSRSFCYLKGFVHFGWLSLLHQPATVLLTKYKVLLPVLRCCSHLYRTRFHPSRSEKFVKENAPLRFGSGSSGTKKFRLFSGEHFAGVGENRVGFLAAEHASYLANPLLAGKFAHRDNGRALFRALLDLIVPRASCRDLW